MGYTEIEQITQADLYPPLPKKEILRRVAGSVVIGTLLVGAAVLPAFVEDSNQPNSTPETSAIILEMHAEQAAAEGLGKTATHELLGE